MTIFNCTILLRMSKKSTSAKIQKIRIQIWKTKTRSAYEKLDIRIQLVFFKLIYILTQIKKISNPESLSLSRFLYSTFPCTLTLPTAVSRNPLISLSIGRHLRHNSPKPHVEARLAWSVVETSPSKLRGAGTHQRSVAMLVEASLWRCSAVVQPSTLAVA